MVLACGRGARGRTMFLGDRNGVNVNEWRTLNRWGKTPKKEDPPQRAPQGVLDYAHLFTAYCSLAFSMLTFVP
jgi:hypothetical protein